MEKEFDFLRIFNELSSEHKENVIKLMLAFKYKDDELVNKIINQVEHVAFAEAKKEDE